MLRDAYVTGLGVCLPNDPVSNTDMEKVLGRLKRQSASMKRRILMKNGITSRHYAIDPATGKVTHTNAKMTAEAIAAPGPKLTQHFRPPRNGRRKRRCSETLT